MLLFLDSRSSTLVLGVEEAGTPRAEAATAEDAMDANAFAISEYAGLSRHVVACDGCCRLLYVHDVGMCMCL